MYVYVIMALEHRFILLHSIHLLKGFEELVSISDEKTPKHACFKTPEIL